MPIQSIPVATEECQQRLARFVAALKDLCVVHAVEMVISDGNLWLVDSKRPGHGNDDWPFVADVELPSLKMTLSCIEQEAFPDNYEALAAAREAGEVW